MKAFAITGLKETSFVDVADPVVGKDFGRNY